MSLGRRSRSNSSLTITERCRAGNIRLVSPTRIWKLFKSSRAAARAMLEAGARILQFRHKGHYTRSMFETAERVARLCRDAGGLLIVNDRADIAMLLGGGLHVGQDDLPAAEARRLVGSDPMVG